MTGILCLTSVGCIQCVAADLAGSETMKWEKIEGTKQAEDYRREDNYMLFIKSDVPPCWVVADHRGIAIERTSDLVASEMSEVFTWADAMIAKDLDSRQVHVKKFIAGEG